MTIIIETIKHSEHRYSTCGDWFRDEDGNLRIKVSDMGNYDYEFLVALHELVEAWLCYNRNISEHEVTNFDKEYELNRSPANHEEPGDSLDAPYRDEHCAATGIEKIMCSMLGIPWSAYESAVESL